MPSSDPSARHPAPFAPIPASARLTFVWAAPLLAFAFVLLTNLVSLPVMIPFVIQQIPAILEGEMFVLPPAGLAAAVAVAFPALAGLAILWARVFERRGLATLGFTRSPLLWLRGFAWGILLAAALTGAALLLVPDDMAMVLEGLPLLLRSDSLPVLVVVLLVLLFLQTGAEEIVYRGWVLSACVARRGVAVGVAVSALGFGVVHIQYLLGAPLPGLVAILSVTLIGVVLAFYALTERSIWGVCGAHCAYNFVVIILATAQALSEQPGRAPFDVIAEIVSDLTALVELNPGLVGSAAVTAALAVIAGLVWRRAARRAAQPLLAD